MNINLKNFLLTVYLLMPISVSSQTFQGTVPDEWVIVESRTTIKVPVNEPISKEYLINISRQEAIESKMGTSITYGNFMKSYEGELDNYEHFIDMTSQFPQGVWKADIIEPEIIEKEAEILRINRFGKLRKRIPAKQFTCYVKGYAQAINQIQPKFEFQIMNGKKQVIIEQKVINNEIKLIAGIDSVFKQGDLFITKFRSSKAGHLAMFMDNGEKAQRMLPYYAFQTKEDVYIESNKWYSFFDISKAAPEERETTDELELMTDKEFDAIRIYFLFSETPFTKDFFFNTSDQAVNKQLPEGYGELPFISSAQFARWLQQNKVLKKDLQLSIVDLLIDNTEK